MSATRVTGLLLAAVLCLAGCGGNGSDGGAGSALGTTDGDSVDAAAIGRAAEAADLPAALDAGERLVADLLDAVEVEERDRSEVRPYRVSLCDEVDDDAPSLVSVARGITFPPERTDAVIDDLVAALEAAGVDGVTVVGADGDVPMVTGVFAEDTWQVAATLNRPDGIGEIRVNSACLPGELPDAG